MKVLLLIIMTTFTLFAVDSIEDLIKEYKNKDYRKVCTKGVRMLQKIRKDENLLTMYAFSCLHVDEINRLYIPVLLLGKTKESRHNKAYLSLIIAQKNLLLSALFDNETYEGLNVPNTDYVLSRVFNLYFQNRYTKNGDVYTMQDSYGKYRVYVQYEKGKKWLIIEEIKDGEKIIHKYR